MEAGIDTHNNQLKVAAKAVVAEILVAMVMATMTMKATMTAAMMTMMTVVALPAAVVAEVVVSTTAEAATVTAGGTDRGSGPFVPSIFFLARPFFLFFVLAGIANTQKQTDDEQREALFLPR